MLSVRSRRKSKKDAVGKQSNKSAVLSVDKEVRPILDGNNATRQSAIQRTEVKKGEFAVVSFTKTGASKTRKTYESVGFEMTRYRHDELTDTHVTVFRGIPKGHSSR